MRTGPPNALDWPKPMSSIRTMRTLGAPAGAFTSKRGGGVALRASSSVIGGYVGSGIGNTVRSVGSTMRAGALPCGTAGPTVNTASASAQPSAAVVEVRMVRAPPGMILGPPLERIPQGGPAEEEDLPLEGVHGAGLELVAGEEATHLGGRRTTWRARGGARRAPTPRPMSDL